MNDRELITMAAKAAGIQIIRWGKTDGAFIGQGSAWSPLVDDGDALRLAVKLGMRVYVYPGDGDDVTVVANDELQAKNAPHISESHGEDKFSATRRAIVRAAAEIGRAMP